MLDTFKEAGKNISRELGRAWENLSEGWRELLSRSSHALTHFVRSKDIEKAGNGTLATFPRWGLLAGETTVANFFARIEPHEPERSTVAVFAIAAKLPHTLWCCEARGRDWRWLAVRGLFGERGCFPLGRFASISSNQADFAGDSLSNKELTS